MKTTNDDDYDVLLRLPAVLQIIPVSRSTWYAGMARGKYPQSVEVGERAVAWRRSQILKLVKKGS